MWGFLRFLRLAVIRALFLALFLLNILPTLLATESAIRPAMVSVMMDWLGDGLRKPVLRFLVFLLRGAGDSKNCEKVPP